MILNLIHRPATGRLRSMFDLQQQMAHLDFAVNDLEKAVQHAVRCGAAVAEEQFSDAWRVMLDPAGHPFCLCQMKSMMESACFALR